METSEGHLGKGLFFPLQRKWSPGGWKGIDGEIREKPGDSRQ